MSVGKITGEQLQAYQEAATKWRKEFLALPVTGLEEILPYVSVRYGIRYKETVGSLSLDAQFRPYKHDIKSGKDAALAFRELETFMGAVDYEFEPNSVATMVIGQKAATKGEAMKNAEIVKAVLVEICKKLSENLNAVLWSAVRKANGTTTADLFNGWDTITAKEITAGNIAEGKGNYVVLENAIDETNAVDVLKGIYRKANRELRRQKTIMFVTQDILDAYEDAYFATHAATPWVKGFEQHILEGSNGRCELVALSSKEGTPYIHLTTKENMLIGVDLMSDTESVTIEHFSAFTLEYVATMFFGVEFESIDPRRLLVAALAEGSGSGSGSGSQG